MEESKNISVDKILLENIFSKIIIKAVMYNFQILKMLSFESKAVCFSYTDIYLSTNFNDLINIFS